MNVRKEIAEITRSPYAIVGIIVFLVFMCAVPVFFVLLPFVIIFLVILYKVGESNNAKALRIARSHTGGVTGNLEILEDMELASSLVLNDWGVVYLPANNKSVEIAWSEIETVNEIGLGMLEFKAGSKTLKIDLSQRRYTLITETLDSMLKGRCNFLVDPGTGESHLLEYLIKKPLQWSIVNLSISDDGIKYDGGEMRWDEIESVVEEEVQHRSSMPTLSLSFSNGRKKLIVPSERVLDGTGLPGSSAYEYLKAIAKEKLERRASFIVPAALPARRGLDEFKRMQDACKAAYAAVLQSGKYDVVEPRFAEMLRIVDKFDLANQTCVQQFFHDYALLLERMGRDKEASALKRRINMPIE